MNSSAFLMRRLMILWVLSLPFLAGCGSTTGQSINQPAPLAPPPAGVAVSPTSATVTASGVQQFTAMVTPSGANQAVAWSLSGIGCSGTNCGSIDATGKYTAPASVPNSPTVTVTAASVSDS